MISFGLRRPIAALTLYPDPFGGPMLWTLRPGGRIITDKLCFVGLCASAGSWADQTGIVGTL